jgi:two-component system chemotaxis sensor kinase CheA
MSAPDSTRSLQQFIRGFRDEATELLKDLEEALLELDARPKEPELIGRIFRALHTIKGTSSMFNLDNIASVAHRLENTFDDVRQGRLAVTPQLVSLALGGKDLVRALLDGDGASARLTADELFESLALLTGPPAAHVAANAPKPSTGQTRTFRITFKPKRDLLLDGTNPLGIWPDLMALGAGQVVAHTRGIPPLEDMDPEACYVTWDAVLCTESDESVLREVFMFVEDRGELRIELIDDNTSDDTTYKRLGEILVERGELDRAKLDEALRAQPRLGEVLAEKGFVSRDAVDAALVEQRIVRDSRAARASLGQPEPAANVRVPAEKLDALVDLVGELVIAQSRLSQVAASREDAELVAIAEDVERLSAELRDNTLNLRMVPIGSTFGRFKRLVRDLSTELNKRIELLTDGAETELDKTVMERLADPLVHLIRNSCDHGVEAPQLRSELGKPPTGTVRLTAYQSGPNVIIEVQDDGAGLDPIAIREKAVTRGLVDAEAKLSEQELFQLIFLPGFSTAKAVSTVSGRGVGMDVVKRSIDALRGSVDVESTRRVGTTIRIKLPLTLAIIDGLLVAVGESKYVLPTAVVEECVEISRHEVTAAKGAHLVPVRGELVPYVRLREWFREAGAPPSIEQVAITSTDGIRFGFAVDEVIGQHQTVIKTMGRMFGDSEGLSGATILGDGTVALIVDVAGVMRSATVEA